MEKRKRRESLTAADLHVINKLKSPANSFIYDWKTQYEKFLNAEERKIFFSNLSISLKYDKDCSEHWFCTREDAQKLYTYLRGQYTRARAKKKPGKTLSSLQIQLLEKMSFIDEFILDKPEVHQVDSIVNNNSNSVPKLMNDATPIDLDHDNEQLFIQPVYDDDDLLIVAEVKHENTANDSNMQICDKEGDVWSVWGCDQELLLKSMKQELDENYLYVQNPTPGNNSINEDIVSVSAIKTGRKSDESSDLVQDEEDFEPVMKMAKIETTPFVTDQDQNNMYKKVFNDSDLKKKQVDVCNEEKWNATLLEKDIEAVTKSSQILQEAASKARIIGMMLQKCNTENYCNNLIKIMDIFREFQV